VDTRQRRTQAKWIAGIVLIFSLTLLGTQSIYPKDFSREYPLGDIPLDPITYQKHLKFWPQDMAGESLPLAYDARDEGIVTSAKNQGSCGSCWAFASAGAMESHMLKAYNDGPTDLSEQQQVSCNTAMWGCSGGSSTAIRYWQAKGPLYEGCFPYTASDSTPCAEALCDQLGYRVVDWHTVPETITDFKTSLYVYGPSYWRYDVYNDFYTYWNQGNPGDVYVNSANSSFEGGHAVLLIGWDESKGAFLCKNSWGTTGGPNDDGTFWIAYSGHGHDLGFGMANFSLTAVGCSSNADCDDGLFCNGAETCANSICQTGTPPSCSDDGLFCNGTELCDEINDTCGHSGDPCGVGTTCNEEQNRCMLPTCGNAVCDEGENCTNCFEDCISGQGGSCDACFKGACDGVCHPVKENLTCADCAPSYCCGDGTCEGGETVDNCAVDCGCSSDGDCDDGQGCTVDTCDVATGTCNNEWPACGLDDGCCGPGCTSATDPNCASACVENKKWCNCDGVCNPKFESNASCPWDCP
jgi:hypothetical protein